MVFTICLKRRQNQPTLSREMGLDGERVRLQAWQFEYLHVLLTPQDQAGADPLWLEVEDNKGDGK